jgi:hypothetical protein
VEWRHHPVSLTTLAAAPPHRTCATPKF